MTSKKLLIAAALLAMGSLATASASFAAGSNSSRYARGYYDYAPGYDTANNGPANYSGYASGQPGPSSSIEAIR